MVTLKGTAPSWTFDEGVDLTKVSGLDGASHPDWYIPADQLPPPTAPPASAGASAAASAVP
jgi:hypothetical protein